MSRPPADTVAADAEKIAAPPPGRPGEVFVAFLKLGLTSFGGPVAHIGYFRDEFVQRRQWLGERAYADLVALCQFLPGPASSQVGFALGLTRAGWLGGFAAWIAFTLPSALLMALFGLGMLSFGDGIGGGALHGLKVVAVAVVAQAVWGMARTLCPDRQRVTLMGLAAVLALAWPTALGQIAAILAGGLAGWLWLKPAGDGGGHVALTVPVGRTVGAVLLAAFFLLLVGLPLAASVAPSQALALLDSFYRAGALVFGGGHVVLPLLQAGVVGPGWVSADAFLAGYGAAQAVPGPLFTFAAYLGFVAGPTPNGWLGALLCTVAIFLPSFLLVAGALPFWEGLRRLRAMQAALLGVNAAVVGILLAALYQPVWTGAIFGPLDVALALVAFLALVFWKLPPWLVVLLTALGGAALGMLAG